MGRVGLSRACRGSIPVEDSEDTSFSGNSSKRGLKRKKPCDTGSVTRGRGRSSDTRGRGKSSANNNVSDTTKKQGSSTRGRGKSSATNSIRDTTKKQCSSTRGRGGKTNKTATRGKKSATPVVECISDDDDDDFSTPINAPRHVADLETSVDVLMLDTSSDSDGSVSNDSDRIGHYDSDCAVDTDEAKENRTPSSNCSSDDEILIEEKNKVVPLAGFDPTLTFSDSDSDDLYAVNHNDIKNFAAAAAEKGLQEARQQEHYSSGATLKKHTSRRYRPNKLSVNLSDDSDGDSRYDSISPPSSPDIANVQLSARKTFKMSKKTQELFAKVDQIGKNNELNFDVSLNKTGNEDDLRELTEDEINPIINMRLKHGLEYTKMPIRMNSQFGYIYQQLAEKHEVSFDDIVLSLQDDMLDHNQTPADVGLTSVDIVVFGIIKPVSSDKASSDINDEKSDPNAITLKFQCSARRGVEIITINKFEKVISAMQKYAAKKQVEMSSLRFMFDGEKLDPNDTAITLDLEGGECVDVYPAS